MLFITVTAVNILDPLIFILLIFQFEPIQVECFTPFVSLVTIILLCEFFSPFSCLLIAILCVSLHVWCDLAIDFSIWFSLIFSKFILLQHTDVLLHNYRHRNDTVWRLSSIPIFSSFVSQTDASEWWNGNYKTNKWKSLDCFHVIST